MVIVSNKNTGDWVSLSIILNTINVVYSVHFEQVLACWEQLLKIVPRALKQLEKLRPTNVYLRQTFTCSKSTIETLEKIAKYVQT